jgi:protein ImuA
MATDRAATLAALRARLEHMQGRKPKGQAIPVAGVVDPALPGGDGLPRGASHEIAAAEADSGSAFGFAAMLAGRACAGPDPLTTFWIEPEPSIWPAGAFRFGLRPESLVIVAASGVDSLWAAEEALRCPDVGATCLVHSKPIDMPSSRRLQLAAETGGGIGLILVRPQALAQPSAVRTRWRVAAAPGIGAREYALGEPTWHVELAKAAGGRPGTWDLVWCEEDQALIPVFAVEEHLKRRDQAAAGLW